MRELLKSLLIPVLGTGILVGMLSWILTSSSTPPLPRPPRFTEMRREWGEGYSFVVLFDTYDGRCLLVTKQGGVTPVACTPPESR